MRKSAQSTKCSSEIKSTELTQVGGAATLSVGNLLLSVTDTTSATSNIDTALQLGPW
jgi:hypothetical protein